MGGDGLQWPLMLLTSNTAQTVALLCSHSIAPDKTLLTQPVMRHIISGSTDNRATAQTTFAILQIALCQGDVVSQGGVHQGSPPCESPGSWHNAPNDSAKEFLHSCRIDSSTSDITCQMV